MTAAVTNAPSINLGTSGQMQIGGAAANQSSGGSLTATRNLVPRPPPQDARGKNLSGDPYVRQVMEEFSKQTTLEGQMAVLKEGFRGWWIDDRTVLFAGDQQGDLNGKVMSLLLSAHSSRPLMAFDTLFAVLFENGSRHMLVSQDIMQGVKNHITDAVYVTREGTIVSGQYVNDASIGSAGLGALKARVEEYEQARNEAETHLRAALKSRREYEEWYRKFDQDHGLASTPPYQPSAGSIFYMDRLPASVEQLLPAGSPLLGKPFEAKTVLEALSIEKEVNNAIKLSNPGAAHVAIWSNIESGAPFAHKEKVTAMLELLKTDSNAYITQYMPANTSPTAFDFAREKDVLETMLAKDERWCNNHRTLNSVMNSMARVRSHFDGFVESWRKMSLDPEALKSGKAFQKAFELDYAPKLKANGNIDIMFSASYPNPNFRNSATDPVLVTHSDFREVSVNDYWDIRKKFEFLEKLEGLNASRPTELFKVDPNIASHQAYQNLTNEQVYQQLSADCKQAATQMFGLPPGVEITSKSVRAGSATGGFEEATLAINVATGKLLTNTLAEAKVQWQSIETAAKGDLIPVMKELSTLARTLSSIP